VHFLQNLLRAGHGKRLADALVWAACALLAILFLSEDVRIVSSTKQDFYMRETVADLSEIQEIERWLLANVSRADVVASDRPAGLFLATGLRGQYFWPDTDPYALYYGADRRWWQFYWWPGQQEIQNIYAQMRSQFAGTYSKAGISYYVEHVGANAQSAALAKLIVERPQSFVLCHTSPKAGYRVYRMNLPVPVSGERR